MAANQVIRIFNVWSNSNTDCDGRGAKFHIMLRGNSHKRSFTSSHLDSDLFVENFSHSDALFRIAFGN